MPGMHIVVRLRRALSEWSCLTALLQSVLKLAHLRLVPGEGAHTTEISRVCVYADR
jgi:hypothetical protein